MAAGLGIHRLHVARLAACATSGGDTFAKEKRQVPLTQRSPCLHVTLVTLNPMLPECTLIAVARTGIFEEVIPCVLFVH